MPEMHFIVRWPDGGESRCYSPSLVVRDYLEVGRSYPLADFLDRSRTMLNIGSERVRARYGYACSGALDQLAEIEARATGVDAAAPVTVLAFELAPERPPKERPNV
ncbi:MAG TPA: MSMEG_0570 family nitrogen starvation response protein [Polyangia bacterium]|nr:MSMEG_0570 family nitrogen starvation response protein [Polyangia bacterium]